MPVPALTAPGQYAFTLHGGHFFGPGPIVPDTPLPDGSIHGISFDLDKLEGVAAFAAGGRILSDGKTTTNGNIDAGALEIGRPQTGDKAEDKGSGKTEGKVFWLYAVAGGPNEGRERYHFDADYNMIWTVDLALDPGFPEGIVRVNNFELITTVGGMAYGPGPMPATPITDVQFTHVKLDARLEGEVAFFNNGPDEPNIPGEKEIFGSFRGGLLSNGVPFNEHLHGGIINIGQGALRMLAVVASDGPNRGGETYRIDERLNWQLRTDMALDPGFPEGLVVSRDIHITSGVLWVPPSLQTEAGIPGGIDRADYLPTGAPIVGSLGDADEDGFLDGRIVGIGRTPLKFLFVPGAPLVMSRTIVTDIPVTPRVSGVLELASVANLSIILNPPQGAPAPGSAIDVYYTRMLPEWAEDFAARTRRAARLKKIDAPEAALAQAVADELTAALAMKSDRTKYSAKVKDALARLEAALPTLRATFQAETARKP